VTLAVRQLDPAAYVPHPTHQGERVWAESNCYVDLWTELLHANGFEPVACLPFTAGVDLEGDQWTFFKYPLADLYQLYGIDVFELNIWGSLLSHVEEQLRLGRPVIVETDAWYLPDTRGVSYRTEHTKTSIAIQMLDLSGQRLGYFHNAGYFELCGEDFAGTFGLEGRLPPYVEVAKLGARKPRVRADVAAASRELLREHLRRRPATNPFPRYAERFATDLEWLSGQPLEAFHRYAFSGLRQCGAAFELLSVYLRWLGAQGYPAPDEAVPAFEGISSSAKALQFKTARFVNTRKPFDPAALLAEMGAQWEAGMNALASRYSV
jgi:hypothetical protein